MSLHLSCHVVVCMFAATFENTMLTDCPTVFREATAIREINTRSNAYSVKTWPSSSSHNTFSVCMSQSFPELRHRPDTSRIISELGPILCQKRLQQDQSVTF